MLNFLTSEASKKLFRAQHSYVFLISLSIGCCSVEREGAYRCVNAVGERRRKDEGKAPQPALRTPPKGAYILPALLTATMSLTTTSLPQRIRTGVGGILLHPFTRDQLRILIL